MTSINNKIPLENKKPIELVEEINNKYEVPSFEEFMKTYEADGNLNYDDLTHSDISDKGKGYGPCSDGRNWSDCPCSREELQKCYWVAINSNNITIQNNITNIWVNSWPNTLPQNSQPFYFRIFIFGGGSWAEYRWITRIKDGGVGGDSSEWKSATFRNEWVTREMIIRNIKNARRTLTALESGGISARGGQFGGAAYDSTSQDLVASATRQLRDAIARWDRGEIIDEIRSADA